jgi:hypothetical protein
VLAHGTRGTATCPQVTVKADPVLVEAARRLGRPRLRGRLAS